MQNPVISFIILSYNKPKLLLDTLESLYAQVKVPYFEVIVLDNNSFENNVEQVKKQFPKVRLILNQENLGFAKACNIGADNAKGKYLAFVNSDIIFYSNPMTKIIEILESQNEIGVVGLQLLNPDKSLQPSSHRFPSLKLRLIQLSGLKKLIIKLYPKIQVSAQSGFVDFVSGGFMVLSKELFAKVGKFDEFYFMYYEDCDLCYQIQKNGKKIYKLCEGDVVHLGKNYEEFENEFSFILLNKGQIYFFKKNYGRAKTCIIIFMNLFFFLIKRLLFLLSENKKKHIKLIKKAISLNTEQLRTM